MPKTSLSIGAVLLVTLGFAGITYAKFGGSGLFDSNSVELQKGLIGWWKLDGNAKDNTMNNDNGTLIGGPTAAADRKNTLSGAINFSGTQYINIPSSPVLNTSTFTISAWFNISNVAHNNTIVGNSADGGPDLYIGNGGFNFSHQGSGSGGCANGSATAGQWYQVVITSDGSATRMYRNGVSVCAGPATTFSFSNYQIGTRLSGSDNFLGSLDDVRVYNRVLNSNEIKALYDGYNPSTKIGNIESGLVSWLQMDGNTKDSSINSNAVTASNVSLTSDRKGRANSAYSFNGTTSAISSLTQGFMALNAQQSGGAWIYPTSVSGYHDVMAIIASGNGTQLRINNGYLEVSKFGGSSAMISLTPVVAANSWHYVAYTYDGSTVKLYYDGQLVGSGTASLQTGSTTSMYVGTYGSAEYFSGSIDDVRVYSRALSQSDITRIYTAYNSQIALNTNRPASASGNIYSGLIGSWNFNGNTMDDTVYSDNGTVVNASLSTDRKGRANSAYSFNGTTTKITLPDTQTLHLHQQYSAGFSIAAWVKTTVAGGNIINCRAAGPSNQWTLFVSGSGYAAANYIAGGPTGSTATGTTVITNGQWHLITGIFDRTNGKIFLYVDGVLQTSLSTTELSAVSGSDNCGRSATIGADSVSGPNYSGSIDDIKIYGRTLTAAEVQTLYQQYQ